MGIMKINYATADLWSGAPKILTHTSGVKDERIRSRLIFSSFDGVRSIMRVMRINSLVILSSLPFTPLDI